MGTGQCQLPALITPPPPFVQGLGSTRRAPAEPNLWKLAPAAGWAPTCLGSFCFRSKPEDAPFSQRPCTSTLPPVICQQSMMLSILIEVYLSNLATRVPYLELITMSGFSYMYSSVASHLCTLWTKFLPMDVSIYIRD